MPNHPKKTASGTNIEDVKKQNQRAAKQQQQPNQKQYSTEFASETNTQEVKKQNEQSQQQKK